MSTVTLPAEYCFSVGTSIQEDTGVAYDQADDGSPGLRDLYDQSYFDLSVRFSALSKTQQEWLTTFLRNNRMSDIVMDLNGTSYTGLITRAPKSDFDKGAGYATVSVGFRARLTDA